MDTDALEKRAFAWNGADRMLNVGCSIPFWTFRPEPPSVGRLRLEVEAWGPQFRPERFRDPQLDGFASVSIQRAGSFYAALSPSANHPDVPVFNAHVRDNVDAVLQLIDVLHESVSVTSLKVFDDNGIALPFNAHFAYYRGPSEIAKDLRYLSEIWEKGLRWYPDDPPMKALDPREDGIYFDLSRSDAERRRLRGRLAELLPHAGRLSEEAVRDVLINCSEPVPMLALLVASISMITNS